MKNVPNYEIPLPSIIHTERFTFAVEELMGVLYSDVTYVCVEIINKASNKTTK